MISRFLERLGKRISADTNAVSPSCNPDPLLTGTSLKSQPYEFIRSDPDLASDVAHQGSDSGPQRQLHTADPLGVDKFVACLNVLFRFTKDIETRPELFHTDPRVWR